MITKNPFNGLLLKELFPEPHQMAHGDKRTVKRMMSTTFFALDFCRSMGNGVLTPEVWSVIYSINALGAKSDGEDQVAVGRFASILDRYIPGTMPQDIREYSVMTKLLVAQKESSDPAEFFPAIHLALSMLIDSKKEIPKPESVFGQKVLFVYSFVRDAFVVHETIMSGARAPMVFPVSRNSLPYVSTICRDFVLNDAENIGQDEPWESYVEKTWAMFVRKTFPCLGSASNIGSVPNLSKSMGGRELMLARLVQAREKKNNWPEDFSVEAMGLVSGGFYRGSLFDSERARNLLKLVIPDFNMMNYVGNRRRILSGLKWSNIELVTVTSLPRYKKIRETGEFRSIWELPASEWDYSCSDLPQDARAMSDLRLWGEAGFCVTYCVGILPFEERDLSAQNLSHLARIHGKDEPVLLSMNSELILRSSITVGASFENFIAFAFRPETLLWLVEARMFFSRMFSVPAMAEELNHLIRSDEQWRSWAMVMSGVKSPYFEFQIHGRIDSDQVRRAVNLLPDGTKKDITNDDGYTDPPVD